MNLAERMALLRMRGTQEGSEVEIDAKPSHSLAQRLQRLGSRAISPRRKIDDESVARLLRGEVIAHGLVQIDNTVPLSHRHGKVLLAELRKAPLSLIGLPENVALETLLFFDTETTGLAGGTGTVAILIGLARIDGEAIRIRQYLLTGFAGETAMLSATRDWIDEAAHLVSFNGKSFDAPLLAARYRLARSRDPLIDKDHLDLLHATRRAFGGAWDDCRLQTAEQQLFGLHRDDDMPGAMIPQVWGEFLRGGAADPLRGVAQHNLLDVLSLSALLSVVATAYAQPGHEHANALGIARALRRRGDEALSLSHLQQSCRVLDQRAQMELASLHRRCGEWAPAVEIWHALAHGGYLSAALSLAKYHEHVSRDFEEALRWTRTLLAAEPQRHQQRYARLLRRSPLAM
jgi:hypothetical protein